MITNTKQSVKISLSFCQIRDNPKSVSEVANPAGAVKVKVHGAFSANLDRPARVRFAVGKAGKHPWCLPASFDFECRGTVFLPPGSGENLPQFDVRFDTGDEGRGLVYLPPLPAPSRYNTLHFASQSRVPKGGNSPLWKPPPTSIHQLIYHIIHYMD